MSDEHDDSVKVVDRRWWARGDDGEGPRAGQAGQKPTYVEELERRTADAEKQAQKAPRPGSGQAGDETRDLLLQGVEMVQQQFLSKLDGFGVKRIDALGAEFDPSLHEAVTAVPAPDASSDGRVMGVITHGYRIGDEVLRPALVAVGKAALEAGS